MDEQVIWLGAITLLAAIVNGALGYGFSSITVPLALLFMNSRVLNPALIAIEVPLNAYVLWVNRDALPAVWRRVLPVVIGLVPGILAGTLLLSRVSPDWLKLATYVVLLPLILLQAAGIRRPVAAERPAGFAFGAGLGALYSVTTISGPPLAIALVNQGLDKREFRAALGMIRLTESLFTAGAYAAAGFFTAQSLSIVPWIAPTVLLGVPLGVQLIRHLQARTFRRVCMSFDAYIVTFGLSTLMRALGLVAGMSAYLPLALVALLDGWMLYRFFTLTGSRDPIEPAATVAYAAPGGAPTD